MLANKDIMMDGIHTRRPHSAPNRREHRLILITWDAARHLHPQLDQLILRRYLDDHPSVIEMFENFSRIPRNELTSSYPFQDKAAKILRRLGVIINSLGDRDALNIELEKIGESHFNRGTTIGMFEGYFRAVVVVLREMLGNQFTEEAVAAWESGIQFFVTSVANLYEIHGSRVPLFNLDEFAS